MDRREIVQHRLRNQLLTGAGAADPAEVVRHFGAVQSQEFAVATWAVAQRSDGVDDTAMRRLFDDGAILRTHALRPTWHFVTPQDIRWIQALTGPRVRALNAYHERQTGVDAELMAKVIKLLTGALQGGNHLTRGEIGQVLAAAGIEAAGVRMAYVLMWAELDAAICSGPMRGKQHTYALVSERAPQAVTMTGDEALAELTRRYFTSHGPATIKDFAWWSSLTTTQIRRGLDLCGSALTSVDIDGRVFWYAERPAPEPTTAAHALPIYDEYVVAYTDSRPLIVIDGHTLPSLIPNATTHSVLVGGKLAGFWRRSTGRDGITAELDLVIEPDAGQRAEIERAFARYAAFAGRPVTVLPAEGS